MWFSRDHFPGPVWLPQVQPPSGSVPRSHVVQQHLIQVYRYRYTCIRCCCTTPRRDELSPEVTAPYPAESYLPLIQCRVPGVRFSSPIRASDDKRTTGDVNRPPALRDLWRAQVTDPRALPYHRKAMTRTRICLLCSENNAAGCP